MARLAIVALFMLMIPLYAALGISIHNSGHKHPLTTAYTQDKQAEGFFGKGYWPWCDEVPAPAYDLPDDQVSWVPCYMR